jgi:hypothetical protein
VISNTREKTGKKLKKEPPLPCPPTDTHKQEPLICDSSIKSFQERVLKIKEKTDE